MLARVLTALLCLLSARVSTADIFRVGTKGNVIAPLRSTEIAMDAETVIVEPERRFGGFRVTADFTMRNTTGEVVMHDVAFPFDSQGSATNAQESFRVVLGEDPNAKPVRDISLKVRDPAIKVPRSPYDYAAALVWQVTWAPHEKKLIRLAFDMGDIEDYRELANGWRLRYVVRTGALWHGPIGRADITVRFDGHQMYAGAISAPTAPYKVCYSYATNAKRVSPTEVSWHFENWTPEEDIWVGMFRWDGLYRTKFDQVSPRTARSAPIKTPQPYRGATVDYTEQLIESLVESLLEPWHTHFPAEVQRDRPAIKTFAAEWLYREIFARNGDSFYVGRGIQESRRPPGSSTDRSGITYSVWRNRFLYDKTSLEPWYKPGTAKGPDGTVRERDLTAQERRNLNFLKPYFLP